jgi:CRP-like cAMP-binding protein
MLTSAKLNHLLGLLPSQSRFLEVGKIVPLKLGAVLCEANTRLQHVYFPVSGFISLIHGDQGAEVGLVGTEGVFGATLLLGVNESPVRALVQGEGTAICIPAKVFKGVAGAYPDVADICGRYLFVSMALFTQTAACNSRHSLQQRLARWLLMSHDRAHSSSFALTQQFLSAMLGVRRSSVSAAAAGLQSKGIIRYQRGDMTIVNRKALENVSCECYRAVADIYTRYLGKPRSMRK